MKYDLKKTKTSDAETFEHLMTILMIFLEDAREFRKGTRSQSVIPSSEKKWDLRHKKEQELFDKAFKYLKSYIKELIKQNK